MALSTTGVRARRLQKLVDDERKTIDLIRSRIGRRRAALGELVTQLEADEELLESRLSKFDDRLRNLDAWKKGPVVIVRTSPGGYGMPVYHDAKQPCGFGENLFGHRSLLLAEAEEAGHPPCSSCGRRAIRRREPAAA